VVGLVLRDGGRDEHEDDEDGGRHRPGHPLLPACVHGPSSWMAGGGWVMDRDSGGEAWLAGGEVE